MGVIKFSIKDNHVNVVGHNHVCMDSHPFFLDAKPHTLHKDLGGFWVNKNRQPIEDNKGDVIDIYSIYEILAIHGLIILRINLET